VGKAASNKSQDSLMDHSSNYTQNDNHLPGEYLDYLDLQPDLICLFQSDFVLQFSNAAFDSFFLIDERQPRLLFSDYFHPSQQEELEAQLESLKQGKKQLSFQTLQHNKYGETRQLHWVCHYLNPGLIQASARDLTQGEELRSKPLAAMPLPASEINSKSNNAGHRSQGIFNKLPFMVWALDEELNIVFWNPAAEKLIGYSREEVLYNNEIFTKLFPDPTIRDEYYQKINNCFPTVEWNVRIRCKNNSDKWISCFDIGNLYHIEGWKYVLIGIDRTDEKETELALQASEQRYRSLFSSTQAGLILCHQVVDNKGQADYILIDHNRAVERMLSKTKLDLREQSVHSLFPNIAESWDKSCQKLKPGEQDRFQYYYHPRQQIFEFTLFSPAPGEFAAFFEDITEIIDTRDQLCNQLEFMQTLIDTIPNPIFFKNPEGRFINCNKAFEMYVGSSREDIINRDIAILSPYLEPFDLDKIWKLEQDLIDDPRPVHHEYSFRQPDGSTMDFMINRAPFFDMAGNFAGIVGVLTNISEKREMQRQLQTQLHFQQFLTDIIPAPIFFLDTKGHYFKCNQAFEDYIGKKRDEIIGRRAEELPECMDLWQHYLAGHLEEKDLSASSSNQAPIRFRHADGSIRYVIINRTVYHNTEGVPAGLAGIILDITAQRNAETRLLEQVKFLETLIETIPNPVYYRSLEGILIECNRAFAELMGKAREELIGKHHRSMYSKEQIEALHASDQDLLNSENKRLSYNSIIEFADGRQVDLLINKAIIHDNEGSPIGILGALTDLTEHREMQKTMARLDQYRIIGEMAAAIGHEVRNPMTTVRGFLQLLNENEALNGNKEYFDLMIEEIDRANSIITDFLSLGKGLHTELKPENLNTIIENSFLILSAEAKKHDHSMELNLGQVPIIPLDFKQTRQLIFNLVRNGLEAMSKPGTMTISTSTEKDGILLSIRDQGSGIDASILEKLGKPFVTTKEKGTGLGLAVCYSIVERHGAQLEVETGQDGTVFYIKFPLPPPTADNSNYE
jgi:two-component system, sporulation sensor kinase E